MEIRSGYAHTATDIEIHYEDLGNPDDPPVLLIMGLGAQLVLWHNELCQKLLDRGYRVIRFDNRDVGLSSKLHGQRHDGALIPRLLRSFVGLSSPSVYRLEDMADDAAALLDHLGIERAHIARAFRALGPAEAVFGPAPDGGYWLVGLKRPRPAPREIFADVRWSSSHALRDTVRSLAGARIAYVDSLRDVDEAADLAMTAQGARARSGV